MRVNDDRLIMEGSRVLAFDSSLYIDDKKTPTNFTMRPATVLRRYGKVSECLKYVYGKYEGENLRYPDLVDVVFDYNGKLSNGHFTVGVKELTE